MTKKQHAERDRWHSEERLLFDASGLNGNKLSSSSHRKLSSAGTGLAFVSTGGKKRPRLGRECRRFSTASCCRSTRFSKTRFPRLRKRRIRTPIQRKSRLNMARSYNSFIFQDRWSSNAFALIHFDITNST